MMFANFCTLSAMPIPSVILREVAGSLSAARTGSCDFAQDDGMSGRRRIP